MEVSDDYKEGYRAGLWGFATGVHEYIRSAKGDGATAKQVLDVLTYASDPQKLTAACEKALAAHVEHLGRDPCQCQHCDCQQAVDKDGLCLACVTHCEAGGSAHD